MAKKQAKFKPGVVRKLQPKLRMVANGSPHVNVLRAERSASVFIREEDLLKKYRQRRRAGDAPVRFSRKKMKRGHLQEFPGNVLVNVFIGMTDGAKREERLPGESARQENVATATVTLNELQEILKEPDVAFVELGERLVVPPTLKEPSDSTPEPRKSLPRIPLPTTRGRSKGVLVGIIDVQGFDFAHKDFLDGRGRTRFVRIWDQGGTTRPGPRRFGYGAELGNKDLNAAIAGAKRFHVAPHELERQSQMAPGSHGTHVASIAAGNRGICPHAKIAGVLISLSEEDIDRRKSFYDSTRIAHAIEYLFDVAREEGGEDGDLPVSINISLGTNGHAHDASSPLSRWIDSALATPGRSICMAAGNAGQEAPETEGDYGYVMGRIHTSGRIEAAGLREDIKWNVVGGLVEGPLGNEVRIADLSENELEIWYSPQDRFSVLLRPPDGDWIGPVRAGESKENIRLADSTMVSIYNELYHPANGSNCVSIYLSPFFSPDGVVGVRGGQWTVRLVGDEVRDGTYHGWIERDDPQPRGPVGSKQGWSFPSFFSEDSNVDDSSVSSLACGHRTISVGNLDSVRGRINISSSQGPTRDGREKPEISAPGTEIVAANGFDPSSPWISMTGTSMASPYAAGVVGLMLAVNSELTAAQIGGIIKRTARPLVGSDFAWRNDSGFGEIDSEACVEEAALMRS